ncbi:MAG TPA: hypothetical protein VIJ82_10070 [Streptosporangiaceae bacterium]
MRPLRQAPLAEVTMYQPYPSSGQPVEPLRPPAPAPVLTAVKLMYAGATVNTVTLIISLSLIGGIKAALRKANPSLTAPQLSDLNTLITLAIVSGLVIIALWLWMARANGQGRNWARILSTVLFGLATLELISEYPGSHLGHFVIGGQVQPVIHFGFGVTVLGLIVPLLTWLVGLAAVWLLWRPASGAFFKPQAGHSARASSRIRSSSSRLPRRL